MIGAVAGPLCALLLWFTPIEGLSPEPHHMLAIMSWIAIWWISEPVPIPVTSLLGPTLCVILEIAPIKDAFDNFANPMIFLFMGSFLLAKAIMVHGLDKRFAYGLLSSKWVGDSPRRIFLAIGVAAMLCSGWISNTATAAMMFPIALGLLEAIREMMAQNGQTIDLTKYKYATGLMLMTAYACSIGGVMTPIGTPPNMIMLGFLEQLAPDAPKISFFQWMLWGIPAMILYFVLAAVVLWRLFPADMNHIKGANTFIAKYVSELGPWNRAQKNTVFAFGVAIVLWIIPSIAKPILGSSEIITLYEKSFPEAIGAMVGGLLLFLLPVNLSKGEATLSWKQGVEGIDWGTIVLFGGGLSMGAMIYTTGLSDWIGNGLKVITGSNPSEWLFVGVFSVFALVLSELTSHTAATNLIAPIAIGTALSLGFSPVPVVIGIALSSSLGFMLPVSTPPNAIVYASGYVPLTKMVKSGIIIDFFGILFITLPLVILLVKAVI